MAWSDDVLDFWFGLEPEQYWKANPVLDEAVRSRFLKLWTGKRQDVPQEFLANERDALAGVILFDQMPRNMFRGHADQYSTDPLALAIAKGAVDMRLDERMSPSQRGMLYMPFMHSEDKAEQERSMLLFTALGDADQLDFAKRHHDVIARFGRFPHRNVLLGRAPRPDEAAAGDAVPW